MVVERRLPDFETGPFRAKSHRQNGTGRCYGTVEGNEEQHVNGVNSHFHPLDLLLVLTEDILSTRVSPTRAKL